MAQRGGLFRRDNGKNHGVGLADDIIAATAENLDVGLITLNKRHYPMPKTFTFAIKIIDLCRTLNPNVKKQGRTTHLKRKETVIENSYIIFIDK